MAAGGPKPTTFYLERQALTRLPATPAAPSGKDNLHAFNQIDPGVGQTNAGDGIFLTGLMAVMVSIYPNPPATLSGAGTLLCWLYNPFQQVWTRCKDWDLSLSSSSGLPAQTFDVRKLSVRLGYIANWVTSGVTVSAGADVLVRIDGFDSVLGMGV